MEVITDSLLVRLMHHELAHTLYSHLAAIFGDLEPIAIEPPAEQTNLSVRTCTSSRMALTQRTPQKLSKEKLLKKPAQPHTSRTTQIVTKTLVVNHHQ